MCSIELKPAYNPHTENHTVIGNRNFVEVFFRVYNCRHFNENTVLKSIKLVYRSLALRFFWHVL